VTDTLSDPGLVAPVEDVLPSVTDTLSDPGLVAPVDDVGPAVGEALGGLVPVDDVVPSVTDTLSDPGLLAPVDDVVPSVGEALGGLAPVEDVVPAVVGAVPVDDVLPAAEGGAGLVGALTSSVDAGGGPVGDGVEAVVAPFTSSVDAGLPGLAEDGGWVGPLTTSVVPDGVAVDPFSVTVAPATAPPTDGGSAAVGGAAVDAPPDPSPQQALADGAASTAVPAATAGVPVAEPGGVFDPLSAPGGLGGGELGSAAVAGPPPVAADDPAPLLTPPPTDPTPADPTTSVVPPIPNGDGGGVLDVVAQVGQDTRIVATAAVLTLAGAALIGPRAGGTTPDARIAFTNVRLLPCLVKEGAGRQLTALTEALAPVAAPAAASLSGGAGLAGAPGAAGRDALGVDAEHAHGRLGRMFADLSDGFGQATREATTGEAADGLSDTRLVVQFGMLLGVVYLAFLSAWFWLTRGRVRPPAA
jgi:hypothetical protein